MTVAGGALRTGRSPLAPLVILVALAFAAFLLLRVNAHLGVKSPGPAPVIADPDQTLPGFSGELPGADHNRLVARLSPMHADPGVQTFDSEALEARFQLGDGEPWRLRLAWETADEGDASADAPGWDLRAVEVRDEQGIALRSLPIAVTAPSERAPADPLATLLGPPGEALRAGFETDLVLWGRAPGANARVEGLGPASESQRAALSACFGAQSTVALAPQAIRRAELGGPLARLDRAPAPAGKNADSEASSGAPDAPARDAARPGRF